MEKFTLYYDFAKMRYLQTFQQNRDFDIKASGMLALAVTLAGIAAVVVKDVPMNPKDRIACEILIAIISFLAGYVAVVACSVRALSLRPWLFPDAADLSEKIETMKNKVAVEWTADALRDTDAHNMKITSEKARWVNAGLIALVFLVIPIGFLAVRIYLA